MKWSIHAYDRPLRSWFRYDTEKACRSHIAEYLSQTDEKDGVKYVLAECHPVRFDPEK